MKKYIAVISALIILSSSFVSCNDKSDIDDKTTSITTQTTTYHTTDRDDLTTAATTQTSVTVTHTTTVSKTTTIHSTSNIITTTMKPENLTNVQENSIAWLNYLAMLSQEINSSQNSKMYLEEAYAALINNTNPANVNELTESHLVSLLDTIEKYRMIAVKRDRLKYIYEQNKAKALKASIPNPVGLLSATESLDLKKLIVSCLYMAVDSYSSYSAYKNEMNQEYLKDGWALDDEAAEYLHDSRKRAFTYMIHIVRQDNLPGDLALNESAIEKFVDCKNNPNVNQQIQFLETNKDTYHAFGSYWLLLAECYYNNQQYQKCLDCISEYEDLNSDIFRKDYELAKTLPLAVAAASQVQSKDEYVSTAEKYLKMITDNTESEQWDLTYFAAEIYVDLYSKTQNKEYLQSAYDLALNNVNYLTAKQEDINNTYITAVKKVSIPKTVTNSEKKKIEAYNDALEKKRETELPEIYEPLAINCDLLFAVANKLNISQADKDHIDGILSDGNKSIFLIKPIRNVFTFRPTKMFFASEYNKDEITLPVSCVSQGAKIRVTVTGENQYAIYDDWKIAEVKRTGNDISLFKAVYKSKNAGECNWHIGDFIKVEIFNGDYSNNSPVEIDFRVIKKEVGVSSIRFEQVV